MEVAGAMETEGEEEEMIDVFTTTAAGAGDTAVADDRRVGTAGVVTAATVATTAAAMTAGRGAAQVAAGAIAVVVEVKVGRAPGPKASRSPRE